MQFALMHVGVDVSAYCWSGAAQPRSKQATCQVVTRSCDSNMVNSTQNRKFTTFQHLWAVSSLVTCYNLGGFPERGSGVIDRGRGGVISWMCGSPSGENKCQITERFLAFYCLNATGTMHSSCCILISLTSNNNIDRPIAFTTETWLTTKQSDSAATLNDFYRAMPCHE